MREMRCSRDAREKNILKRNYLEGSVGPAVSQVELEGVRESDSKNICRGVRGGKRDWKGARKWLQAVIPWNTSGLILQGQVGQTVPDEAGCGAMAQS
jgi:hypothetical protein